MPRGVIRFRSLSGLSKTLLLQPSVRKKSTTGVAMHILLEIPMRSCRKLLTPGALLMFTFLLLFVNAALGQTVTALYSFSGGGSTGNGPLDAVTQGQDGELYGTTRNGDNGSIFKVSTSTIFEQLYSFNSSSSCCPVAGLTLATDGNFYGVTQLGGAAGQGAFFEITSDGSYTDLHDFEGKSDGGGPSSPPIEGSDGNLYGMTDNMDGTGSTVYRYTSSVGLSTIYQFSNAYSHSPIIQASDGFLYGTTIDGGWAHCGTIFKMSTAGVLLQSAPFLCGGAGHFPGPLVQASDGNFYGTTQEGGSMERPPKRRRKV